MILCFILKQKSVVGFLLFNLTIKFFIKKSCSGSFTIKVFYWKNFFHFSGFFIKIQAELQRK